MQLLFRGTQTEKSERTARGLVSYTPSLAAAIVYSAMPGDSWRNKEAHFTPKSTVQVIQLKKVKVLDLRPLGLYAALSEVLGIIGYDKNISKDEVRRVYNYMHNRLTGRAKGGDFRYKVYDTEGEEVYADSVPLSFPHPQTLISYEAREEFDEYPSIATTANVVADTFIFVDSPAIQEAAQRLGYAAILYTDVFEGGVKAAKDLLGLSKKNFIAFHGLRRDHDIEQDFVLAHDTFRIISNSAIGKKSRMTTSEAIELLESERV